MSIPYAFNPMGISSSSSSKNPFTITAISDGTFYVYYRTIGYPTEHLQYNLNNGGWNTMQVGASSKTVLNVYSGDVVQIRGDENFNADLDGSRNLQIGGTANFNASGNIMSLNNFGSSIMVNRFFYNSNVVDASELLLPLTDLTGSSYYYMFQNCYSLISAPKILPATTLSSNCYNAMFYHCTSLVNTPEIMVETISSSVGNALYQMFMSCSSINEVKIHIKQNEGSQNFLDWLYGTSSNGTIYLPIDGAGESAIEYETSNWNVTYF